MRLHVLACPFLDVIRPLDATVGILARKSSNFAVLEANSYASIDLWTRDSAFDRGFSSFEWRFNLLMLSVLTALTYKISSFACPGAANNYEIGRTQCRATASCNKILLSSKRKETMGKERSCQKSIAAF